MFFFNSMKPCSYETVLPTAGSHVCPRPYMLLIMTYNTLTEDTFSICRVHLFYEETRLSALI